MSHRISKYFSTLATVLLLPLMAAAQERGLDQRIDEAFRPVATAFESAVFYPMPLPAPFNIPIILYLLIGGALFFTIAFGFVNFRRFPLAISVVRGKYDDIELAPDHVDPHVEKNEINVIDGDIPDTIKD